MRVDQLELREASYGSNEGEYSNGKIGYNSTKKAWYLVTPIDSTFNLVCIQYFNGNCVFTTTDSQEVNKLLSGSVEALLRPINIARALAHVDDVAELFATIIKKYRNRIPTIRFTTFDNTNANKMKLALAKPALRAVLTRYNYKYVESVREGNAFMEVYSNESQ